MTTDPTSRTTAPARGIAVACFVIGISLVAVSVDWIAVPAESIEAPRWLLAAVGMVVIFAGLLTGRWWCDERVNQSLAAALLTLLGIIGGWVSLYGRAEGFRAAVGNAEPTTVMSSPWPARLLFGFGSIVALGWAAVIWSRVLRQRS